MTRTASHIISIACVSLMTLSCSHGDAPSPSRETTRFGIDTRAEADAVTPGTTYRIMAYSTGNFQFVKTGTYWLKELPPEGDVAELTPCLLNDEGDHIGDTDKGELDGLASTYNMVFVSPGVRNNDDGSFSICLETDRFVASEIPEAKNLGAYGRVTMNHPMKEYRALIGLNFYKLASDAVDRFEITDLRIGGAGNADEKVKLFPASRQVVASSDGVIPVTLTDESAGNIADSKGNPLLFSTKEADMAAVVPAVYAPRSVVAEIIKTASPNSLPESDYLVLKCTLRQGGRQGIPVELPLTAEMPQIMPQNKYMYHIVVSSNYISLSVTVYDDSLNNWEAGGSDDCIIGAPDTVLGTWKIVGTGDDWELQPLPEQIIG